MSDDRSGETKRYAVWNTLDRVGCAIIVARSPQRATAMFRKAYRLGPLDEVNCDLATDEELANCHRRESDLLWKEQDESRRDAAKSRSAEIFVIREHERQRCEAMLKGVAIKGEMAESGWHLYFVYDSPHKYGSLVVVARNSDQAIYRYRLHFDAKYDRPNHTHCRFAIGDEVGNAEANGNIDDTEVKLEKQLEDSRREAIAAATLASHKTAPQQLPPQDEEEESFISLYSLLDELTSIKEKLSRLPASIAKAMVKAQHTEEERLLRLRIKAANAEEKAAIAKADAMRRKPPLLVTMSSDEIDDMQEREVIVQSW